MQTDIPQTTTKPAKRYLVTFQPSPEAWKALRKAKRNRRVNRTRILNECIVGHLGNPEAKL